MSGPTSDRRRSAARVGAAFARTLLTGAVGTAWSAQRQPAAPTDSGGGSSPPGTSAADPPPVAVPSAAPAKE